QEVQAKFEQVRAALPDQMKADRAKKFTIYVMPDAFDIHRDIPAIETGTVPDIIDVWIGQISLWIQEDVVNAINETNSDAKGKLIVGIERAPVKRRRAITIPKEYVTSGGRVPMAQFKQQPGVAGGVAGVGGTESPDATGGQPAAQPADAKTRVYSLSATGR